MTKKFIPAISVVIPLYNAEKYIGECLDSILAQTLQDFEIVIVDDCSTDNSCAIVEKYSDDRIKLIRRKKNSGYAGIPRGDGIKFARGEYISFLDSDDLITKTAFENMYTTAKKFDADIVHCEKYYQFTNNPANYQTISCNAISSLNKPSLMSGKIEDRINYLINYNILWNLWSKLVRRDLLFENNIEMISSLGEDFLCTVLLICAAKKIVRVPHAINYYRVIETSISNRTKNPAKIFSNWLSALIQGTAYVDKFLDEQKDFQQRIDLKYNVFEVIVREFLQYFLPIYSRLSPYQLDEIIRAELAKFDNKDALMAFIFSRMNIFNLNLIQQQQIIQQLQK